MKKEVLVIILSIFLIISIFTLVKINPDISGKASFTLTSVNITVDAGLPIIIITLPQNTTYNNKTILINYTATDSSGISKCFFSIDYGPNFTLGNCNNFSMYLFFGSHTLIMYANDTANNLNNSLISFFVNKSLEFNFTNFGGSTTNFSTFNETQLQNISNVTLENINFGKFKFLESLNLSNNTDFDQYFNISFNRIEFNSSALPSLNKSAALTLYNLTFTNPRITKDGSACSEAICKKISYTNGQLEFNITSFSTYSAEETPSSGSPGSSSSGSSGGGGGGSSGSVVKLAGSFSLDKDLIKISIEEGQVKKEFFKITNNGNTESEVTIDLEEAKDFVSFIGIGREYKFKLKPGESKTIELLFITAESIKPGLYHNKIKVSNNRVEKFINLLIELESKEPTFDVKIGLFESHISPGSDLIAEIALTQVKGHDLIDVFIEYEIRKEDGNRLALSSETRAVHTQTTFIKKIKTPPNSRAGNYILYVSAFYNNTLGSSTEHFTIVPKESPFSNINNKYYLIIIIIMLLITLILLWWLYKKNKVNHKKLKGKK